MSVEYPHFSTWKWSSFYGGEFRSVIAFIQEHINDDFAIGTDSQNWIGDQLTKFVTVLIAHNKNRGGFIIRTVHKLPLINSLRQRLIMEAMLSLEVAWFVSSSIPDASKIGVHLDVSDNLHYKSSNYKEELVTLITAQGFDALIKPFSWAASSVADRITK
jgi:uncharacterized protein